MNKNGTLAIFMFGLCMIAALSVLYWSGAKEKLMAAGNMTGKQQVPIYSVATEKRQISLTFDANRGNDDTQAILDILAKHNVHATFFVTGDWVNSYPADLKSIQAGGHDLGSHSQTHQHMSRLSAAERQAELNAVHNKVKELTGTEMNLFRPPYGDYNDSVILDAKNCGYNTVLWSVNSLDWKDYGANSIVKTVCEHKNLRDGAIILCHTGTKYTAQALDALITQLKADGYQLVPLSQLIYKDNYHIDQNGTQIAN